MLRELKYAIGTLVGRPRREAFLKMLPRDSVGAEIGVFKGEYTRFILRIVRPRKLHLIDGWSKIFGTHYPENWGPHSNFGKLTTREVIESAEKVVQRYAPPGVVQFHEADDLECLPTFPDGYFDWVYLDTSHFYEHTLRELEILKDKVKPDGLITGDDWQEDASHVHNGVCRAVREFCAAHGWELVTLDRFGQWCLRRK